jgi:hypothetical protein
MPVPIPKKKPRPEDDQAAVEAWCGKKRKVAVLRRQKFVDANPRTSVTTNPSNTVFTSET